MAEKKIILTPGINSLATQTLNAAGWFSCNLVRWLNGFLQTIGGWQKWNTTPVVGVARTMHAGIDLDANKWLMVGTNSRLQLYSGGTQYDITPLTSTASLTNAFSTTISTTTIDVADTAHGAAVGDWVFLQIPLAIGGVVLWEYYQVTEVAGVDNYSFDSGVTATSTVTNGGDTPTFTTTIASANVSVGLVNHGYLAGQVFTVQYSTLVGGLTIVGEYQVQSVTNANVFVIDGGAPAGSSAGPTSENSDAEVVDYLLASGPVSSFALTGWGSGGWGEGGWGEGGGGDVAIEPLRIWSLDSFGEDGLAVPTNGALYVWLPPASLNNRATIVPTAPIFNTGMFVSMPQAQVVLFGSETGSVQDPLLIRWSDVGSYTDYVATSINQAGSFRLGGSASRIICAFLAGQTCVIMTDTDFWTMDYQGPPFIYSINLLAQNCSLISQLAVAKDGSSLFWMSQKGFFKFQSNSVSALACPIWDTVFNDLDTDNQDKCVAASNTPFNEVWFFYPSLSGGTGEIDKYVKYNSSDNLWDFGTLERTAWIDQSMYGMPIGVDASGYLQQHEMGYLDDGLPMTDVYAESGFADLSDGDDIIFMDQFIPDMKTLDTDATYEMTIKGTNYPNTTATEFGPYEVSTATNLISKRMRKRQLAFRFDFDGENFFRLGAVRYRYAPSGKERGS